MLGVGGLEGWSALGLACCGIGELLLINFDHVELTNLNRQVIYTEADIGKPKASAAANRLRAFNSSMRVEDGSSVLTAKRLLPKRSTATTS